LLKIYIKALLLIFFVAFFLGGLLISIVENLPALEGYKIMWEIITSKENPFGTYNPATLVIKSFIFISSWLIIPLIMILLPRILKSNKKVDFKIIMENKPNFQLKVVNNGTLVARDTEIKLHKKILCIYVDGRKVDKKDLEHFQRVYHLEYEGRIKIYPSGSNVGYDRYNIQPGEAVIIPLRGYLIRKVTEAVAKGLRGDETITLIAKATLEIMSAMVKKQKSFKYKHTFRSIYPPLSAWMQYLSEVENLDFIECALFSLSWLGWCPNKIRATK